jgi:hypothetical protein
MTFIIAIVLFVGLCGYLDAQLGWSPGPRRRR